MSHVAFALPLVMAAALLIAPQAHALQPLDTFLRSARSSGTENREALANSEVTRAQALAATGRLLPGVSLRATYTRNQYETAFTLPLAGGNTISTTLISREAWAGAATITVPLLDLANFTRAAAAQTSVTAASQQVLNTALETESRVAQDYFQVVADQGLIEASQHALEVAVASFEVAKIRFQAGSVAQLDVERAQAEVERQTQQLASAQLQLVIHSRSLQSRSGVEPQTAGAAPSIADDLHEEAPEESFQPADSALPAVASAIESHRAQQQQARAQRLALLPSLSGSITENGSSAPGFSSHDWYWQAVVTLGWNFDLTTVASIRAQDAQVNAASAREERARLAARDAIHRSWSTVHTSIIRSRSARTQALVSARAAELARNRYEVGAAAQLDLLQAQRDAFTADASRVQADADLLNARAQLRIASGHSLLSND